MQTQNRKVTGAKAPALRFLEFSDSWEEKRLGDIALFQKGRSISKEDISIDGDLECIRYGELYTRYKEVIRSVKSRTHLKSGDLILSETNDVIIPASGETQWDIATVSCILKDGVALGGDINIIRSKEDGVFLAYYLGNARRRNIARLSQGNSVVHLYSSQLKSLKLLLPSTDEQQKIAGALGVVDEKIEGLRKKKASLEQYKKGVMQKIFSVSPPPARGGVSAEADKGVGANPSFRFKDENGNPYPDWEEKRLGDFLMPTLREVPKPVAPYLALGIRSHFKGTFQKPNSDPDKIAMDTLYSVTEGDLIVNITFAWEGAVAIAKKEDEGGLVSHRFPTYTFDDTVALRDFFRFVFPRERMKYDLTNVSPGGAGRNRVLNKRDFLRLRTYVPSVEEQKKIADFLTNLDEKMSAIGNELSRAKEFKKGLLQQMFV